MSLLSKEQILSLPRHPRTKPLCGVYFLLSIDIYKDTSEIVYVGKSVNALSRIVAHYYRLSINSWDYYTFIETETEADAITLEAKYIILFKPKYNIQGKARTMRDIEFDHDRLVYLRETEERLKSEEIRRNWNRNPPAVKEQYRQQGYDFDSYYDQLWAERKAIEQRSLEKRRVAKERTEKFSEKPIRSGHSRIMRPRIKLRKVKESTNV